MFRYKGIYWFAERIIVDYYYQEYTTRASHIIYTISVPCTDK